MSSMRERSRSPPSSLSVWRWCWKQENAVWYWQWFRATIHWVETHRAIPDTPIDASSSSSTSAHRSEPIARASSEWWNADDLASVAVCAMHELTSHHIICTGTFSALSTLALYKRQTLHSV